MNRWLFETMYLVRAAPRIGQARIALSFTAVVVAIAGGAVACTGMSCGEPAYGDAGFRTGLVTIFVWASCLFVERGLRWLQRSM